MPNSRAQADAYTNHISRRKDHSYSRQMFLQRGVFATFDRLMRHYTASSLRGNILDLGGINATFCQVCRDIIGANAVEIGIQHGADFECDEFKYKESFFDVACANSLIEHLHNPGMLLSETFRVLRPGGHFIVVTPHWPYCAREFYEAYTHVQPYTAQSLRAALECHGFEVVAMVPWMVNKSNFFWDIPAPWSFRFASWLPFVGLDERRWIPSFFKGRSRSLLVLARKPR